MDEERRTVTHSVEVSLFPGWVGGAQQRVVRLDDDALELSGAAPEESGGKLVVTRIRWVRAGATT